MKLELKKTLVLFLVLNIVLYSLNVGASLDPKACKRNPPQIQNRDGAQNISNISYDSAQLIFEEIKKSRNKIPYLEATKNCENRAHAISELLFKKFGLSTVKVFIQPNRSVSSTQNSDSTSNPIEFGATGSAYLSGGDDKVLLTPTSKVSQRAYSWDYHTAPAICVVRNGKSELFVLDPSLFNQPTHYIEWQNLVTKGLSQNQFESYSTSMFNISRLDETISSPRHTDFSRENSRLVTRNLRLDWSQHRRLLRSVPSLNSTKSSTNDSTNGSTAEGTN